MSRYQYLNLSRANAVLCAILLLVSNVAANAASDGVCSTASLINPTTINGGMGGTGMPEKGGMGGTGITEEHSGFGGTGAPVAQKGLGGTGSPVAEKGMGGTGISVAENNLLPADEGGIAIVGVITGFASICVDGVEVQYSTDTPVFDNGKASKLGHLAVGKMVMLKAERVGGQLQARAIGMFDAVAGPLGRVDSAKQQLQVMGQMVRVDKNTIQQMNNVTAGTAVRVSGHRLESGEIIATRVDVTNNNATVNTMGVVTSISRDGIDVNGTRVSVSDAKVLANINVGSEVRVSGIWDGKGIKSNRLEAQPIKNMINRADVAIVEGYLGPNGHSKFNLYGTELEFTKGSNEQNNLTESKLVKIEMRRQKDGNWVADKVETRKGKLFERDIQFKNEGDSNSGSSLNNAGSGKSDQNKSDNSGSGSNLGSSSGSSSGGGSSSSGGTSGSSSASRGSSGSGSSGRSSGGGSSSSSGGSSRGGSGKYK